MITSENGKKYYSRDDSDFYTNKYPAGNDRPEKIYCYSSDCVSVQVGTQSGDGDHIITELSIDIGGCCFEGNQHKHEMKLYGGWERDSLIDCLEFAVAALKECKK